MPQDRVCLKTTEMDYPTNDLKRMKFTQDFKLIYTHRPYENPSPKKGTKNTHPLVNKLDFKTSRVYEHFCKVNGEDGHIMINFKFSIGS